MEFKNVKHIMNIVRLNMDSNLNDKIGNNFRSRFNESVGYVTEYESNRKNRVLMVFWNSIVVKIKNSINHELQIKIKNGIQ